jgi:hypothetical protein
MKKILIAACLLASFTVKSQTIKYDSEHGYQYVSVQPVLSLDDTVTRIYTRLIFDDFSDNATFYYELKNERSETVKRGNLTISGDDYSNWNANSQIEAYQFIASMALKNKELIIK